MFVSISVSTISILISAAYPWISLRISVKPNSNRICDSTLSLYIWQRNFCQDICTFYKICFLNNSEPKLTVLIFSVICSVVDIDSEKLKCLHCLPFGVIKVYENLQTRSKADNANWHDHSPTIPTNLLSSNEKVERIIKVKEVRRR